MLYMFLLFHDPDLAPDPDAIDRHFGFAQEARQNKAYVTSEALTPIETARSLRVRGGKTLTSDGPFAETKEVMGGYYLLDCRDMNEALRYAAKIPTPEGGGVEIRPVWNVPDWPYEISGERFA